MWDSNSPVFTVDIQVPSLNDRTVEEFKDTDILFSVRTI